MIETTVINPFGFAGLKVRASSMIANDEVWVSFKTLDRLVKEHSLELQPKQDDPSPPEEEMQ